MPKLRSRQRSCSELPAGMVHLAECKKELPDEALQAQLEDRATCSDVEVRPTWLDPFVQN